MVPSMTNTIELKYATRACRVTPAIRLRRIGDGVDGALYASWLAGFGDEAPVSPSISTSPIAGRSANTVAATEVRR